LPKRNRKNYSYKEFGHLERKHKMKLNVTILHNHVFTLYKKWSKDKEMPSWEGKLYHEIYMELNNATMYFNV
jgi:hypothetical protein